MQRKQVTLALVLLLMCMSLIPRIKHDFWQEWLIKLYPDQASARQFDSIYQLNAWNVGGELALNATETRAGPGSTFNYTANIRAFLGEFIAKHQIKTMADLSCSEMRWQPAIPGFDKLELFAGFDIVPQAIVVAGIRLAGGNLTMDTDEDDEETHKVHVAHASHTHSNVKLMVRDMVNQPLDRAFDLVMVRDTFFHLPVIDALKALGHIQNSGSQFFATTTIDDPTIRNSFIYPGEWYPINVFQPPFNFPRPLDSILEGYPGVDYYGTKRFGIWKLPLEPITGKIPT